MDTRQRFRTKQDWITFTNTPPQKNLLDLGELRKQCYKEIEQLRGRPLLIYCSKFPSQQNEFAPIDLSDIEAFTDLVNTATPSDSVDVLIHSAGGYPDATERIVHVLRSKYKEVHF